MSVLVQFRVTTPDPCTLPRVSDTPSSPTPAAAPPFTRPTVPDPLGFAQAFDV